MHLSLSVWASSASLLLLLFCDRPESRVWAVWAGQEGREVQKKQEEDGRKRGERELRAVLEREIIKEGIELTEQAEIETGEERERVRE